MKRIIRVGLIVAAIGLLLFGVVRYNSGRTEMLDSANDEKIDIAPAIEEGVEEAVIDEKDFIRTDTQGNVDVGILFKNLIDSGDDTLEFEVLLNTHSVNLDNIEYASLVRLRNGSGLVIDKGFEWDIIEGSGHHIVGNLSIPKKYKEQEIINDTTVFIELEIVDLDGIGSRRFTWDEEALLYYYKAQKEN